MMLRYKDSSFSFFDLLALEKFLKSVLLKSSEEEWGKSQLNENTL